MNAKDSFQQLVRNLKLSSTLETGIPHEPASVDPSVK